MVTALDDKSQTDFLGKENQLKDKIIEPIKILVISKLPQFSSDYPVKLVFRTLFVMIIFTFLQFIIISISLYGINIKN